jgi:hypothetical protein
MTDFCFRLKFRLPPHIGIQVEDSIWPLVPAGETPFVLLRAIPDDVPIKNAEWLVVRGEPYENGDLAKQAGETWQAALEIAFAAQRIGADFGLWGPTGGFTQTGLDLLQEQSGERVLNDDHGLSVFECEPKPKFAGLTVEPRIERHAGNLRKALDAARGRRPQLEETRSIAFHLFSSSLFTPAADARLLLLMMAIETLIELGPRPEPAMSHVRNLIQRTEAAEMNEENRASLLGSLNLLRKESISAAGRRLASRLEPRAYMDRSPVEFFTYCYQLRGSLVHGDVPRPAVGKVAVAAGFLEQFVGDLLTLPEA